MAPVTSLALSDGVSIIPNGGEDAEPACAMRIGWPPTTTVAVRVAASGFRSMMSDSVMLPRPDAAPTRAHGASEDADHAHAVDSAIVERPPASVHDVWAAFAEYVHVFAPGGVIASIVAEPLSGTDDAIVSLDRSIAYSAWTPPVESSRAVITQSRDSSGATTSERIEMSGMRSTIA